MSVTFNNMWYLFIVLIYFGTVTSHEESQINSQAIDTFIQRLKLENWAEEETPCLENTFTLLENVKNYTLWATWVWNANTLPTGNLYASWTNLGSFDQCMKPPWLETHLHFRTKYCLAQVTLSDKPKKKPEYDPYDSTDEYLNSPTISRFPVNGLLWGVCVPAACNPPSIAKMTRAMYDITHFGTVRPNITVDDCQLAGTKTQYPIGFYLFFVLIASLAIIAAVSTYYRNYITSEDQSPESLVSIISKSFCIFKNQQDLVKENKDEIKVMNGMRFITAASIVPLHVTFFMLISGISNTLDIEKDVIGYGRFFLHLDVLVDTFLVMSGLLHIKGLLANIERQQNLFKVLWKRYIRLIGPFGLSIFYIISVSKYTGTGPLWIKANELESEVCAKTWRLSLLMLNSDPKTLCHAVTWYIPCDYQLAILGTALFYFYQKDRRLGYAVFGIATVLSMLIPAALTYWYRLPPLHFLNLGYVLLSLRDNWELGYTYMPSYSRAGTYLAGVAMGYLMTLYKPANYKKTIPKTHSIIGTAICLAVMGFVLSLGGVYIIREYSAMEAAFTAVANRIAWAIAICCIIGFCEYGTVPLVSEFLSLPFFTPLGRLSYGIYIIHPLIIQRNKFALRTPHRYDIFSILTDSTGTLAMSIGLSYLLWILVEAPLINMSNHFLFNTSKDKESKKVTEIGQNGIHHRGQKGNQQNGENGIQQNGHNGILHQNGHAKSKAL